MEANYERHKAIEDEGERFCCGGVFCATVDLEVIPQEVPMVRERLRIPFLTSPCAGNEGSLQ